MKLTSDFQLIRYGVSVRLADEEDSAFILSLRTNEHLARFLHQTSPDLEEQRKWMAAYKLREQKGEDYYFIYSKEGIPFGVNRIYDIHDNIGTGGSWICQPGTDVEDSMASLLIMRDIMFENLHLAYDKFDVRKLNKKVQKVHLLLGAEREGDLFREKERFYAIVEYTLLIMELNDFILKFAEQFDETELSEFKPDTIFQELEEWSSLIAMGIIAFVKTEYGKVITGKEIRSCHTIEDLFNLVASK